MLVNNMTGIRSNHPNVFHPELEPGLEWTGYLAEKLGRMPSLGGNAAEVIVDYDAILARLVTDIDHARNHVHLLYFLFAADTARAERSSATWRAECSWTPWVLAPPCPF